MNKFKTVGVRGVPKLVAVAGCIGSGKDLIGQYLIDNFGYKRMSFATSLKDVVASVFRWDRELIDGLTPESRIFRETPDPWWTERLDLGIPITPRWATVHMGTEVMRNHFHPQVWILSLLRQIEIHEGPVVLTDARFLNELSFVRDQMGMVLGVHRRTPHWLKPFYEGLNRARFDDTYHATELNLSVDTNRRRLLVTGDAIMRNQIRKEDQVHESEWQHVLWNDYDFIIDNRGSKTMTYDQVMAAISSPKV